MARAEAPEFNEETYQFRGQTYKLREVDVDRYDELVEKATETFDLPDGTEGKRVNQRTLDKLMLDACLVEHPSGRTPLRIAASLQQRLNQLNFGAEPDELKKDKNGKKPEADAESEGAAEGKA